ncbi:MAG: MBL fold metallo-hydrolase [Mycobacteriales bacterium]
MTLEGTNSYLFAGTDGTTVVVDPGPLQEDHLVQLRSYGPIGLILLTHGHLDHCEAAARLAEESGAPVRGADAGRCSNAAPLRDGEVISLAEGELAVLATPGHTFDSVCFEFAAEHALLTGDTVLGRGPSVIAYPDGELADYLLSLGRLAELARERVQLILPGHGPPVRPARRAIEGLLEHRQQRLEAVRAALAAGKREPRQIVECVYREVDPSLWSAAELSVRAQLAYLESGA